MPKHMALRSSSRSPFRPRRHSALRWIIFTLGLASIGVVIGKVSTPSTSSHDPLSPANQLESITLPVTPITAGSGQTPTAAMEDTPSEEIVASSSPIEQGQGQVIDVVVEHGESLSKIFSNLDLPARELDQIVKLGDDALQLTRLRPGEYITFNLSNDHRLERISYQLDIDRTLHVIRAENGDFKSEVQKHPLEYRQTLGTGTIRSSFYQAAVDAGVSPDLVMELAEIFGWKINFLNDIQEGDQFSILYETVYKDGEPVTTGDILAASFVNNGKLFQAVRHTDREGNTAYYTPDGKSLKRGFLRYPVKFSRISSRFSNARLHPVLNTVRAHKGVDLAAPTGTPIHASADGKVTFQGWKGGYGKVVMLQHEGIYSTVYGHMSRFEPTLHEGAHVKQGQVIGYVGSTGHATGPHLHYEFRVKGVHKDPLSAELPEALPIPAKERARFLSESARIMATMARMQNETKSAALPTQETPQSN